MSTDSTPHVGLLAQFQQALDRETHNLARWPDLTGQQLANRLQWSSDTAARMVEAYALRRHRLWLRMKEPFPESKGLVRVLFRHENEINACAVSPDGSFIVSAGGDFIRSLGGSFDYCLRVWDAKTGQERAKLGDPQWPVTSCAIGPGGIIAAGAEDGVVLWDPDTFEAIRTFRDGSFTCAFSPDGSFLVIVGFVLSVIDLPSGEERASALCEGLVKDCAVFPDGRFVVTVGSEQHAEVWEAETAELVATLILDDPSVDATGCSVSPDGSLVAISTEAGEVVLWDFRTDKQWSIRAHDGWATSCAFHPSGALLASTGEDDLVKLWTIPDLEEAAVLEGHAGDVQTCAFTPDGKRIISGSADHTLRVWDLSSMARERPGKSRGTPFSGTSSSGSPLEGARPSPDGGSLARVRPDGAIEVWDACTEERTAILSHFPEDSTPPSSTTPRIGWSWSPDGSRIVSRTRRSLRVWDLLSPDEFIELEGSTALPQECAFTPDGSRVLTTSTDGSMRLWDAGNGALIRLFQTSPTSPINDLALGPDGAWVAVAYTDRTIRIWDLASGVSSLSLRGHEGSVQRCIVSPDGAWIASSSSDGSVRLWSQRDGKLLVSLPGQRTNVSGAIASDLCFSPDARWLAFGAGDGIVALARIDTGRIEARVPIPGLRPTIRLHPWKPEAVFNAGLGGAYPMDMVGIEYGPLVVTAVDMGDGPTVQCPTCSVRHPVQSDWLAEVIDCPSEQCATKLRVNPFTIETHSTRGTQPRRGSEAAAPGRIRFDPQELDTVDWENLTHAYGSAESVPEFILGLGVEDDREREEARYNLLMTILHQGSLYPATVAALPFLVRIAADPSHLGRLEAMNLVTTTVQECRFSDYRDRQEAMLAAGEDLRKYFGDETDLVAAISKVLEAHTELLEPMLSDRDPYIQDMADDLFKEWKGRRGTS